MCSHLLELRPEVLLGTLNSSGGLSDLVGSKRQVTKDDSLLVTGFIDPLQPELSTKGLTKDVLDLKQRTMQRIEQQVISVDKARDLDPLKDLFVSPRGTNDLISITAEEPSSSTQKD